MNVADLVRDAATDHPARPGLTFHGRSISFSELDEMVDMTAAALAGLGVGEGDRVALLAGNVPEFVYTFYGALRIGAVACPLNVMLTPEELGYIIADAGATVVVCDLTSLPGLLSIRDRLADLQTVVTIGGPPAPPGTVAFEDILSDAEPPALDRGPDQLAVLAYTAGTTAAPKGAMLTHGNLLANLDQMSSVPALAEADDDVVLVALPLFHIYALNAVLGLALRNGAAAVLMERFDPVESLSLVERHGVTLLFGAPPMFAAWLEAAEAGTVPSTASVRMAASGAAPLPADVLHRFAERFGITIWEGYGLTESAPAVTTNALGEAPKGDSIGLPLPGLELRLVDESGLDVEEGDPGEIWVRGPNVFAGYWNRPDATALVMQDGWLRTGDIAYRDEDGFLFIVDRKKDLVIVSGFNVFPKEVEEAIARHPKVAEAAVVGVPDERTGEAVQAWVVPVEGGSVTAEEIVDFLGGYLARFKLPREVRVVEELPKHVTGKVLRRLLRADDRGEPAADA